MLAALALCLSSGRGEAQPWQYLGQDSGRFRVIFCDQDAGTVPELWEVLRTRIPVVEQRLQLSLADTVSFLITPSPEEWRRLTAGTPLWANGLARPEIGIAILKSPRFNARYGRSLGVTAVHEYVHLLVKSGAPSAEIPRWLDEGLAQVLAEQMDYRDDALIGRAAVSGRLFGLRGIEGLMGMNDEAARQGYAEAAIAVGWMEKRWGMAGISNLIHAVRQGQPFDEAFRTIFGLTTGAFEADYLDYVTKHYRISFLGDVETWVASAFVVLVLAAGVAVFLRRRRILQRWKHEESRVREPADGSAPPYTINYTVVRGRLQERMEGASPGDEPPGDEPPAGN